MVHAAVHPDWDLADAAPRRARVEARLRSGSQRARALPRRAPSSDPDRDDARAPDELPQRRDRRARGRRSRPRDVEAWHAAWARATATTTASCTATGRCRACTSRPGLRGLDTGCVHHGRGRAGFLTAWIPDSSRTETLRRPRRRISGGSARAVPTTASSAATLTRSPNFSLRVDAHGRRMRTTGATRGDGQGDRGLAFAAGTTEAPRRRTTRETAEASEIRAKPVRGSSSAREAVGENPGARADRWRGEVFPDPGASNQRRGDRGRRSRALRRATGARRSGLPPSEGTRESRCGSAEATWACPVGGPGRPRRLGIARLRLAARASRLPRPCSLRSAAASARLRLAARASRLPGLLAPLGTASARLRLARALALPLCCAPSRRSARREQGGDTAAQRLAAREVPTRSPARSRRLRRGLEGARHRRRSRRRAQGRAAGGGRRVGPRGDRARGAHREPAAPPERRRGAQRRLDRRPLRDRHRSRQDQPREVPARLALGRRRARA